MGNVADNFLPLAVGSRADQLAIRDSLKNGEGSVVPVIFGKVKIDGNQLWLGDIDLSTSHAKLLRYGNESSQAYIASIWFLLGMGKLHILKIRANDKLLADGTDYDLAANFNDGTSTYYPNINSVVRFMLSGGCQMYGYSTNAISVIMSGSVTNESTYYIIGAAASASIIVHTSVTNGITAFLFSSNGINFVNGETKEYYNATAGKWGNNLFVSVGWYSTAGFIYTSPDGKVWTLKSLVTLGITCTPFRAICLDADDIFTVVGDSEIIIRFNADGTYLNKYRYAQTGNLYGVAYGNGIYIAVGVTAAGTALILTSTDGETWTGRSYGLACSLKSIAFNGTYFVAVGTNDNWAKSTDGIVWADGTTGLSGTWNSIAYGDGKFVIGGDAGKLATSITGIASWTDFSGTAFTNIFGVANVKEVYYNEFAVYAWVSKLKGIAHIFFPWSVTPASDFSVVCNSEGKSPSMKFIVQNLLDYGDAYNDLDSDSLTIEDSDGNFIGNNPAAVIYEAIRNSQWGLGIPYEKMDHTSFNAVAAIFDSTRPYGINFASSDIMSAKELIDKITELTDVFLLEENDIFYPKTLYDASATSTLSVGNNDASDVSISRQTWKDVDNVFEGEFTSQDMYFEKKTIVIKNEAAIFNAGGYEKKKKIDLSMFISSAVASQRLNEIMQRESFPKTSASFKMGRAAYALRPGDLITWVNTEYGIKGTFRVTDVSPGGIADMQIQVSVIQAFEDLWDGNFQAVIAASGNVPQRTV